VTCLQDWGVPRVKFKERGLVRTNCAVVGLSVTVCANAIFAT